MSSILILSLINLGISGGISSNLGRLYFGCKGLNGFLAVLNFTQLGNEPSISVLAKLNSRRLRGKCNCLEDVRSISSSLFM